MPITTGRTTTQIAIAQGATPGTTDLVAAPGAGLKIYVTLICFTDTAAGTIKFTEGTGPTDLTGAMSFAANGGMVPIGDGESVVLQTNTANSKLSIVSAGAGSGANGWLRYYIAP